MSLCRKGDASPVGGEPARPDFWHILSGSVIAVYGYGQMQSYEIVLFRQLSLVDKIIKKNIKPSQNAI